MFYKSKIGTITLLLLFVSQSALCRPHGPSTPVKQLRVARTQVLVRHSYCATAVTAKVFGTATATAAATAITVKFGSATISTASSSSTTSDASVIVASDPSTAIASSLRTLPASASSTATAPIPPQPPFSLVGASSTSSSTPGLAPSTISITAPASALSVAGTTTSPPVASSTSNPVNLQVFTGNAGGFSAPAVVASGNQFRVEDNSLFQNKNDALGRSCDVQHNNCANAANASGNKGNFTVAACNEQQSACKAA